MNERIKGTFDQNDELNRLQFDEISRRNSIEKEGLKMHFFPLLKRWQHFKKTFAQRKKGKDVLPILCVRLRQKEKEIEERKKTVAYIEKSLHLKENL